MLCLNHALTGSDHILSCTPLLQQTCSSLPCQCEQTSIYCMDSHIAVLYSYLFARQKAVKWKVCKCINQTKSSIIETKTGLSLDHNLDDQGSRIWFPASDKSFSLLHRVSDQQWCPPILLTNKYNRLFLCDEVVREWSWLLTSVLYQSWEHMETGVHKFQVPNHLGNWILYGGTWYLWFFSIEHALWHFFDT